MASDLIERTEIDGKEAWINYLTAKFEPTTKEKAELVKIIFEDGRTIFGTVKKEKKDEPKKFTAEGECDWVTIHGNPICIKHEGGYQSFESHTAKFEKAIQQYKDREGFSYDTETGKAFSLEDTSTESGKKSNQDSYKSLGGSGKSQYIIGVTNNQGSIDKIRSDYDHARGERRLLGHWKDFNDLSIVKNGISRDEAKDLLRKYKQQAGVVIDPDGSFEFLEAE